MMRKLNYKPRKHNNPNRNFLAALRALTNTNTHTLKQYPYFMSLKYIFVLPYIPYIFTYHHRSTSTTTKLCTLNQIYTNLRRKPKLWTKKKDLWNENLQPNANELRDKISIEKRNIDRYKSVCPREKTSPSNILLVFHWHRIVT